MIILLSILLSICYIRVIYLNIDNDKLRTNIHVLKLEKNMLIVEKENLETKINELNLIIETLEQEPKYLKELLYNKDQQISNLYVRLGYNN